MLNNHACCFCDDIVDLSEKDGLALSLSSLWINRDVGGPELTMFAHYACVKTKLEPLLNRRLDPEFSQALIRAVPTRD